MARGVEAKKLVRALETAHDYVNRMCTELAAGEMDWHVKGCGETIRKQLEHLTGAERYFAGRMGWKLPPKQKRGGVLADYARLLEMYREQLTRRRGKVHLRPFVDKDDHGDHAGWVVMRMCFHALFHGPRISLLRRQRNARWKAPVDGVRWGQLCDYLTTLVEG